MVGGSLAMNALNKLGKIGPPLPPKGSGKGQEQQENKINFADRGADTKQSNDELYADAFGGTAGDDSTVKLADNKASAELNNNGREEIPIVQGQAQIPGLEDTQSLDGSIPDENKQNGAGETNNEPRLANQNSSNEEVALKNNAERENNTIKLKKPTRWQRFKNSTGGKRTIAGMKTAGHYLGNIGEKMPRMVAKAATATAMGTVGVAAGLASGDLSKAVTYGAAAAKIGSNLGDTATTAAENLTKSAMEAPGNIRQRYMENRYDKDELEQKQNELLDKTWRQDKETIEMYKEKFGTDKEENGKRAWENAMDNAKEYRKMGITDDKAIMAAMKLDGLSDDNKTSKERMALAKAASTVKSDKEVKAYGERLSELGISDDKVKQVKKNIRKMNKM